MRIQPTVLAAAALALIAAAPAAAQGTGWTSVGSAKLEGAGGQATAQLRWEPAFREMLVCADGGGLTLAGATLRFRDGTTKPLKLKMRLADGACSAPVSIGKKREIESVDFAYQPATAAAAKKLSLAGR